MSHVRIVASYDDDKTQTIVVIGTLTVEGHLRPKSEAFGYVKDWDEDSNSNLRYPFILEPIDGMQAMLNWGGFDATKSAINILGRKLVKGEKLVRRESSESWQYTIQSIVASEG